MLTRIAEQPDPAIPKHGARGRGESYDGLIARLSRQSVAKHYDAYGDIPWDDPEYRIDPEDPRWERSAEDALGGTQWYRRQPSSTRSRIGLHAIAGHMKTGIEFERVLERGLLEFVATLPDGSPERRYAYHEIIEESQHSLMFQEFIDRSGLPVDGLSPALRRAARGIASLGRTFPELFFVFVLGGEEPIDSVQRGALKAGGDLHPLTKRIMQIHVTEEARHLCFAREFLRHSVPRLRARRMWKLRTAAPAILGEMARLMMQPPAQIVREYGIPGEVIAEAYTNNPAHHAAVLDSISRVRELCLELGVVSRRSVRLWKWWRLWPADAPVPS